MTKKIAFLFPGQGSQYAGMGKDLYNSYSAAKNIFNNANLILGKSISDICFEGPEEELKQTENAQPAIVTTSIAALETLKSQLNIVPDYVAGHSLGEYSALYASGALNLDMTLKLIQKRADLMGQTKGGSMAAILNASDDVIKAGLAEGRKSGYVDIANYNSPSQIVITGADEAVKIAGDYILEHGAKRVVPLAVSGAFHSKFMTEAGKNFDNYLKSFELSDAIIPVITNVDAAITTLSNDFRLKMPRQMYSSVLWTQTIEKMAENGVDTFVEIGPGKVLAGLNKKILPNASVYNIYDKESLLITIEELKSVYAGV